jgi:hypothetical protein
MIPCARKIVFMEGSKQSIGRRTTHKALSLDQKVMEYLQKMGYISDEYQFISVSHFSAVENSLQMFKQLDGQIGSGLEFSAVIDRDARSDQEREEIMNDNSFLYIWRRGSLEGYFIGPELLETFFEKKGYLDAGNKITKNEIEEWIIIAISRKKEDILERYERRLVNRKLKEKSKGHTIKDLGTLTISSDALKIKKMISDLEQKITSVTKATWKEVLPYISCKDLLIDTVNKYADYPKRKLFDLISDILEYSKDEIKNKLPEGWDEIVREFN